MAFDLSRLNIFKRLDARARIFVLLLGVMGVVLIVYFGTRLLSGDATVAASSVAAAPKGLTAVPGGNLTAEYTTALDRANKLQAENAKMTGTSAIATSMKIDQPMAQSSGSQCNVLCSDDSANVKDDLNDWVAQGSVSPEVSSALQQMADKGVSVDEYAAYLDKLVKEGKLTPEQARALLDKYKKQHQNVLLQDSAKTMDAMIKSGSLPIDAANKLLAAQKNGVTTSGYAAELQGLVKQEKLSPEAAAQLLAQYNQQRAKEIVAGSVASLQKMAREGQLTPDVEKALIDLENRMVPVDLYNATLQKYVADGKMTPVVADKILAEFKAQKASMGSTGTVEQLLQKAEDAAYGEIADLLKEGKMSEEVAMQLRTMIKQSVSIDEYQKAVNLLLQQQKLTPEIAKLKIADYQAVKGLRDMSQRLTALQGNNASNANYADELKKSVAAGVITPTQAAQLMQEYQAATTKSFSAPVDLGTGAGSADFAALQQRVEQGSSAQAKVTPEQFGTAEVEAQQASDQDKMARITAMMGAMSGQAQQLLAAWQPPVMQHKAGTPDVPKDKKGNGTAASSTAANGQAATDSASASDVPPLIKSGTIIFGVLDTAVNSDYPDSPVMVTIVDGKYKGAKLLGKLTTAKGVAGQMDRVSLNFTLMNSDDWTKSKAVTAFAIDPDTARTVLATQVDYHYMQKYGAIMATSFLQGYATAITNAGTAVTNLTGTSTTTAALNPSEKIGVALGQIGQNLGSVTQGYVNIPPTVKVDSGVGLGILFMADVTA